MINAVWGITTTPFKRDQLHLLPQQKSILDIVKIHAQQGGFSVIIGDPGVGKTVLREHIESLNDEREITVVSCSRTLHTYRQVIWQLADSFKLETNEKNIESDLIQAAFAQVRERKTLYITYSATIKPLSDEDLERYMVKELERAKMGINAFDEAAMALIIRSSEGNLRLCRNLCYASLIEAARETKKVVSITHVNHVLIQPHWRSHEELIKQQAS